MTKSDILKQFKNEVIELEKELEKKQASKTSLENEKHMLITRNFLKMFLSCTLVAGITLGCFTFFGNTPFIKDDFKKHKRILQTVDSKEHIEEFVKYDNFEHGKSILLYYSSWKKDTESDYSRTINVYDISNLTFDDVKNLLHKSDTELKNIIGTPTDTFLEHSTSCEERDFSEAPHVKGFVYSEDFTDVIVYKESNFQNILISALYISINMLIDMIILQFKKKDRRLTLVKELLESELIDLGETSKMLEIKKNNYERLIRK